MQILIQILSTGHCYKLWCKTRPLGDEGKTTVNTLFFISEVFNCLKKCELQDVNWGQCAHYCVIATVLTDGEKAPQSAQKHKGNVIHMDTETELQLGIFQYCIRGMVGC